MDELPAEVLPVSWLIGSWVGVGTGHYPTIPDFQFAQECQFSCDGRPFLSYWSRAWKLDESGNRDRPAATESGFLRPQPDNELELVLSHPTGFAEVYYGRIEITGLEQSTITGARATLETDAVARTATSKPYVAGQRLYGLVSGELLWTFDMAAMEQPMQNHLAARLQRRGGVE